MDLKSDKVNEISDQLIGQDEKVCSCSVRIAELIRDGHEKEEGGEFSLCQAFAALRQKRGATSREGRQGAGSGPDP